jgi:hypothetical protein
MARIADYLNRKYEDTPKQRIGIGGFTALVRIEEKVIKTAEVPVSFVEDGTEAGDHIILNRLKLSIQGNVSDVFIEPSPILDDLKRTQATVGQVTQYTPARTSAQVQQVNALINDITDQVRAADALLDTGEQVIKYFGNQDSSSKSNRELFIDAMDSLYNGKQRFAVDTQYRRHENMVMTLFEYRAGNQSESIDFSMELTELRLTDSIFVEVTSAPAPASGTNGQLEIEQQKGVQAGKPVDSSLLFTILDR